MGNWIRLAVFIAVSSAVVLYGWKKMSGSASEKGKVLGQLKSVRGQVKVRDAKSSHLHVVLGSEDLVYSGSQFFTGKNSLLHVDFPKLGFLKVSPDSVVKVDSQKNKTIVQFLSGGGELQIERSKKDQLVLGKRPRLRVRPASFEDLMEQQPRTLVKYVGKGVPKQKKRLEQAQNRRDQKIDEPPIVEKEKKEVVQEVAQEVKKTATDFVKSIADTVQKTVDQASKRTEEVANPPPRRTPPPKKVISDLRPQLEKKVSIPRPARQPANRAPSGKDPAKTALSLLGEPPGNSLARSTATVVPKSGSRSTRTASPSAPRLLGPNNGARFGADGNGQTLRWSASQSPVKHYEVLVKSADGKKKNRLFRTKKTNLPLSKLGTGRFRWAVRVVTADGTKGKLSESRRFEVEQPSSIAKPTVLPVKIQ